MKLQLKICGLKDPENILEVISLKPDYIGFIFYPESKRYVADLSPEFLHTLPSNVKKTGVFVNEQLNEVKRIVKAYDLNAIQLHGEESPEYCKLLSELNVEIIKAFGIDEGFDFSVLTAYLSVIDYYLFDTQTPKHGGSGKTFDWSLLQQYKLALPYFLSGGIGLESLEAIKSIDDHRLFAIDVNSRFELSPGIKDLNKLRNLKQLLFKD